MHGGAVDPTTSILGTRNTTQAFSRPAVGIASEWHKCCSVTFVVSCAAYLAQITEVLPSMRPPKRAN